MDEEFRIYVESLHEKYLELINSTKKRIRDITKEETPNGGIYLFSQGKDDLYVGRTKRNILERLKDHINTSSKDAPFAFKLAREITGNLIATYGGEGTRKELMQKPEFLEAYQEAKNEIKEMDVRYVGESDSIKQALLEIYVAVVLKTKYNDFDTH